MSFLFGTGVLAASALVARQMASPWRMNSFFDSRPHPESSSIGINASAAHRSERRPEPLRADATGPSDRRHRAGQQVVPLLVPEPTRWLPPLRLAWRLSARAQAGVGDQRADHRQR